MTERNCCGNCFHYRQKKERCTGFKGYCTRTKLRISEKGYLENGMFRYPEVANNGLCDAYKRDWSKNE